ncbi:MAG: RHS repeat domain-containing protein [Terriglobia bacterium]
MNSNPACGSPGVLVDTTYDGDGRKSTVSNPHCQSYSPTDGTTTYQYDGLARVTQVIPPDGSGSSNNISTSYADNCTTVTDQQSKSRKSCTDGLGRMTQVFEDPGGLNYETDYQYDTLDNLASVLQSGSRQRTFVYDSLSRLTSAANPESGTTAYGYDNDGNLTSKTDARNINIVYYYDALNRLYQKNYSDSTPSVSYAYDQSPCLGQPSCYNIGRRTSMVDAAGSEAWSYDPMGRVWTDQRNTNGVTKTFSYAYNPDGTLFSAAYPTGRTITYSYNGAAQPVSAVDSGSGINFATGATYAPPGGLATAALGNCCAGLGLNYSYNNRLQPSEMDASNSGGKIMQLGYSFNAGSGNNGNVMSITNWLDSTRTQTFTYDSLNRFASASSPAWSENFGIDPWGNLYNVVATGGAPGLSVGIDANTNRISGLGYDAAGNMTWDGLYSYAYNAENQQTSAAGVSYTYDGDGKRVEKSNGKIYWYGGGSDPKLETDLSGNNATEYIFFGGKRMARRDSTGAIYYLFGDHLGTARVMTDSNGNVQQQSDYYPYGGERVITNNVANNYKFTGKERDTETGNDYFGARLYENNLGRFMSPDPIILPNLAGGSSEFVNPQRWNKYAYALNDPLVYVDPNGKWSTAVHNQIIDQVFQNILDSGGIQILKAASLMVDSDQSLAGSYKHGMSAPFQDPSSAEGLGDMFIEENLQEAVRAQMDWESKHGGPDDGKVYLSNDALDFFGTALHTATDRTSPWHSGNQTWWGVLNPAASFGHFLGERWLGPSQEEAIGEAEYQARLLWTRFQNMLKEEREKKPERCIECNYHDEHP